MVGRKTKLTPELQDEIVAYIANGSYDYVAAQAAGISRSTYYRWYESGSRPGSRYSTFRRAVDEARARARVVAENAVFKTKPEVWLRYGPGRERPGAPGWTQAARPWADDVDAETVQAAAKKVAQQNDLDPQELITLAETIARQVERLRRATGDPDLFVRAS